MGERIEQIRFGGSRGDSLSGRLDLPRAEPVAYALFAHCFACSKEVPAATRITHGLVDRGIGVLRFDFTGLGGSEGDFANTNFSSNVEDIIRAADVLRQRGEAPKILIGHSLGGTAVLAAAAQVPEAVAVVTIGALFDPAHFAGLFADAASELGRAQEVSVKIGGRRFPIRRQLLEDASEQNLTDAIRSLQRALLTFHAPSDEVVPIDNARRIFDAAQHPKSFVALDGADHLLTGRTDAAYVADVLGAWVSRYVDAPTTSGPAVSDEGTVVVRDSSRGRLAQVIQAGGHHLIADEPAGVGDDLGLSPYDLLLASLGACTAMTLRLYSDRKGWPLTHASVELRHDRIHAQDIDCKAPPCRIERIEAIVSLGGPLNAEQRQRLLEIAERCPVHRTLMGEKRIITRPADVGPPRPGPDIAEDENERTASAGQTS